MAGGKGKSSGGKSSGGKVGADGNKKQQSHSSKAGLQVSSVWLRDVFMDMEELGKDIRDDFEGVDDMAQDFLRAPLLFAFLRAQMSAYDVESCEAMAAQCAHRYGRSIIKIAIKSTLSTTRRAPASNLTLYVSCMLR